jgi:uncharacterized membrane protein YesL
MKAAMMRRNQFGEGIIFTICNYIWWFLLGNLYFGLTNILFIFAWFGTSAEGVSSFNIINIIALIPTGPALVALFSVMGKLLREKDVDMTRDFFTAYRKNFFEALFHWTIFLIISSIIYFDIVCTKFMPLKIIFIIVAFLLFSMILYVLPIISRFYFKKIDAIKISFYYCLKKIHITLFNWAYLIVLAYTSLKTGNIILVLSFWSIFCYLIMLNEKTILTEIEEKYLRTEGTNN